MDILVQTVRGSERVPTPDDWPRWATLVTIGAAYFVAAVLGLLLALEKTNASPVWPASGVALVAALYLGPRVWPAVAGGAFVANMVVFLVEQPASPWLVTIVSTVIAGGNALEALAGGALVRHWMDDRSGLDRAENVFKFVAAVLIACTVSATIGSTCTSLVGIASWEMYRTVWFTWWLGDVTGMLVLTPMWLAWRGRGGMRAAMRRWPEVAAFLVALWVTSQIAFGEWFQPRNSGYPLTYLPFPVLLWAAFRFGPRGTATALLVVATFAVWGTLLGNGPFVRSTRNESLLLLQTFVGVTSVTILATGAVMVERRALIRNIRELNLGLESRVSRRTRELATANEELTRKIAERKQAEQERGRLMVQLSAANDRLQNLSHRLLVAQENERQRIARELHDDIGQAITATQLNLRALQRQPGGNGLEPQLEETVGMLEEVLERVRDLSLAVRPSMLDDLGLAAALRWYTLNQAHRAGLRPVFRAGRLEDRLDAALETACFRVAQEAVTNVIRHARARKITVDVRREEDQLHLLVRDDGVGCDLAVLRRSGGSRATLGLLGMEERVALVQGRWEFRSAPGQGTEVHAWFPLGKPAGEPEVVGA